MRNFNKENGQREMMNTNEKLESKVSELTNAIKDLSDRPLMSSSDMNELLDSLVSKVEETNEETFTTLTSELSESIVGILDKKYSDIKEKISLFEELISSLKNTGNAKVENEITRILNDIEAIHSKMNSQEIQMEDLSKGFEAVKNASNSSGQISKLCDEIVAISKSYDGITDVLDKNFQEFLRRVETTSSRDEFQRLRYNLENLDSNQNILVSAMNAINDKQDEIKNIIKQTSGAQNIEKMEQLQGALNQMNRLIVETTSKADLEVLTDRLTTVVELINEFKRSFEDSKEDGIKSVLTGQLNNITAQLESLKMNSASNVGEDIIRLYTSIAEFKDSVYSSINAQLKDVVSSIDVKFDKITNSVVNTNLDSNEALANITGEIQKLNSVVVDGLNTKTFEIKQDFAKLGQNNVATIVNAIKGELNNLMNEISSLNNSESIANLSRNIENLRNGIDIDSLIMQIDQINSALDLTPIKEQLELLNKDEAIGLMNEKIDAILGYVRNPEIEEQLKEMKASLNLEGISASINSIEGKLDISSLEEKISNIQSAVENSDLSKDIALLKVQLEEIKNSFNLDNISNAINSIEEKLDFSSLEEKVSLIKYSFENMDFSGDIKSLKDKLEIVSNIEGKLEAFKNIEEATSDIKNKIEENLRLNIQKIDEDKEFKENIQEALNTIHGMISSISNDGAVNEEVANIKENLSLYSSKILEVINDNNSNSEKLVNSIHENLNNRSSDTRDIIEGARANLENSLSGLSEKLNAIDSKLDIKDEEQISNIREAIDNLYEFVKNINSNPVSEQIDSLKENLTSLYTSNAQETKEKFDSFRENLSSNIDLIKRHLEEGINKEFYTNAIVPIFEEFKTSFNEKTNAIEEKIEKGNEDGENLKAYIKEELDSSGASFKAALISGVEAIANSKIDLISEIIRNQLVDVNAEIVNSIKEAAESISVIFNNNQQKTHDEIIAVVERMVEAQDRTASKMEIIRDVEVNFAELTEIANETKASAEANNNVLNSIVAKMDLSEQKTLEVLRSIEETVRAGITKEDATQKSLEIKQLIGRVNESMLSVNSVLNNEVLRKDNLAEIIDQIKEINEDLKAEIENQFAKNADNTDSIVNITASFEEKMSDKISILENIADSGKESITNLASSLEEKINEQISLLENIAASKNDSLNEIVEKIKENNEELKSEIENQFAKNVDNTDSITNLASSLEEKMGDKISILENIIDASMSQFNEKTSEILNSENEVYERIISEKLQQAISELKENYEEKLTDIQKIVDERFFDTISKNNDIIRDELKYRADVVLRDLDKIIQEKFAQDSGENENSATEGSYTIKDVESDLANVRLALEKTNKLTNFKEFAQRLGELKNINLESARITRIIGGDIMKFDGWLKNTTAKLELLAAKIEKSEKIKMEDLKSRLMQSDKNQAMPQKLEEVLTSVYKKYRSQETKMDDVLNKIENLANRQSDGFDAKEFIELLYDTTKKQENIMSRMDSVENQMDLIQGKLDHIISFIQSDD